MAGRAQAAAAKERAFDILDRDFGIRPVSVGIVPLPSDQFGLRVMLPRDPETDPPPTLLSVPVEYSVGERPRLQGQSVAGWRTKAMASKG